MCNHSDGLEEVLFKLSVDYANMLGLETLRKHEQGFRSRFPECTFVDVVVDGKRDHMVVKIYCSWKQYTIPRSFVLVYDVKKEFPNVPWDAEFNPFLSEPKYPNAYRIDWIHMYIVEKFPVLASIERELAEYIEDASQPLDR